MVGFRRQRHDDVEIGVLQLVEKLWLSLAERTQLDAAAPVTVTTRRLPIEP